MTRRAMSRAEAIRAHRDRIILESIPVAIAALTEVCGDRKAPAPARSTAGAALLRAGGMYDRQQEDDSEKSPHEMSPDELARAIARLERRAEELSTGVPLSDGYQDPADDEESGAGVLD